MVGSSQNRKQAQCCAGSQTCSARQPCSDEGPANCLQCQQRAMRAAEEQTSYQHVDQGACMSRKAPNEVHRHRRSMHCATPSPATQVQVVLRRQRCRWSLERRTQHKAHRRGSHLLHLGLRKLPLLRELLPPGRHRSAQRIRRRRHLRGRRRELLLLLLLERRQPRRLRWRDLQTNMKEPSLTKITKNHTSCLSSCCSW